MQRLVMVVKDEKGNEGGAFFIAIQEGEVRIRSAAKWHAGKRQYVEAEFDVVTQTIGATK